MPIEEMGIVCYSSPLAFSAAVPLRLTLVLQEHTPYMNLWSALFILLLFLLAAALSFSAWCCVKLRQARQQADQAQRQLALHETYDAKTQAQQEQLRALWHDIKKYMTAMETLTQQGQEEQARQCLSQVQQAAAQLAPPVDTGNPIVDSILAQGLEKARQAQATLVPQVWVSPQMKLPGADLFILLGNTLDNAIEACAVLPEGMSRAITLTMTQQNQLLFYEISNPYDPGQGPKPGSGHGYGLRNLRACVRRYGGRMTISRDGGLFRVSILVNLPA
jgi:sensor histidine kinase regulating citrate/malate metabolism